MQTITTRRLELIQNDIEVIEQSNDNEYYEIYFKNIEKEPIRFRGTTSISFKTIKYFGKFDVAMVVFS